MNITKLKRLLAAATSWSDPTETIHAQQDLLDMLPELLAVVEAAQRVADYTRLNGNHSYLCDDHETLGDNEQALAALEKRLEAL